MLVTDDVVNLFAAMRTAYGGQWKHGQEAVQVWRSALARFPVEQVHQAANDAMARYVNHPPTLPQFLELLRKPERPNTYLPAPEMRRELANANRILLRVLVSVGGVDSHCLRNLVALKNALIDEPDIDAGRLESELTALAERHDPEAKARETSEARRRMFGTMPGFVQ